MRHRTQDNGVCHNPNDTTLTRGLREGVKRSSPRVDGMMPVTDLYGLVNPGKPRLRRPGIVRTREVQASEAARRRRQTG